jgi:hypothetical protein
VSDFLKQPTFITIEAPKRPILREANIKKRLEMGLKFFDDVEFIRNLLWSDAIVVSCNPKRGKSPSGFLETRKTVWTRINRNSRVMDSR